MKNRSKGLKGKRLLGIVFALLLFTLPASAAQNGYMTAVASTQGQINGEVTLPGREDTIVVHEMHHLFRVEGGNTVHEALIVTILMSKAAPVLLTAMDQDETFNVTIQYWRTNTLGQPVHYYTMTLLNSRLVAAEPIMPDTLNPDLNNFPIRMRLRFAGYASITHTYEDGGIEATLTP